MKEGVVKIFAKLPAVSKLNFVGAVSSDDYKLIRNRIVGHGSGGLKSLVTTLLQKAGWDPKRDDRNIFAPIIEIFMQTPDVNLKRFASFVQNKEKRRFFASYLNSKEKFNLYDMFGKGLSGIYPSESLKRIVDELWKVSTCVNSVGVGPGEICLTALTDARKGVRGDLLLTSVGEVEVKSTYGRLGSGDNSLLFTERIKDLFSTKKLSIKDVRKYREEHQLRKVKFSKDSNAWSWNEAVQSFFQHDWGFQQSTIIAALTYLSTQKLSPQKHGRLAAGVKHLVKEYGIIDLLQSGNRQHLINVVLTVQLCSYQADHGFPYLLSVNKETKDACPLYFSDRVEENVVSIYDQLIFAKRFASNLAIDSEGARKGVEINFV